MNYLELSRIFVSQAAWRITGFDSLGRSLVRSLESEDETCRMMAGMCLSNGGERAERLLLNALQHNNELIDIPMVITVLASMGNPNLVSYLKHYAQSDNQAVAEAASQAIRAIEEARF
ncbi:MAG: hypothetical protein OXG24_03555 [Gammaproteobacteria bacterium]|nr:hypothetical protein [Gammaproteobacteria bacterium]